MYRLGIDLGGTNIVAGIVDKDYNILAKRSVKTERPCSGEKIVKKMLEVSKEAANIAGITFKDISFAGIGSPGIVDSATGNVQYASNLAFDNFALAEAFKSVSKLPTFVSNDANAAAYGEFIAGAGIGCSDFIAVTIGTGIGGGIIIGSKIYTGNNNRAGEIGHMIIKKDGRKCTCNQKGCFETYASATALINDTVTAMKTDKSSHLWRFCGRDLNKVSGRTAFDAMRTGDPLAKKVINNYIEHLGTGILNLINIFSPDRICLCGGISNELDALTVPLRDYLNKQSCTISTEIVTAKLGESAGIIGAAYIMNA